MTIGRASPSAPLSPTPAAARPWVERVHALAGLLAGQLDDRARADARGELWLLLSSALAKCARAQRASRGWLSREDVEDLVATKALDLLRSIEEHRLVLRGGGGGGDPGFEAYLAQVMRNAIIDQSRRGLRQGMITDRVDEAWGVSAADPTVPCPDVPSSGIEVDELARALEACLGGLAPRARRIWIFRTFFEMSSRDIAAHPDVALRPKHVDVLVGRVRAAIRACLGERGFDGSQVEIVGVARLWDRFTGREGTDA